jgi:hypothetical protein
MPPLLLHFIFVLPKTILTFAAYLPAPNNNDGAATPSERPRLNRRVPLSQLALDAVLSALDLAAEAPCS